MLAGPALPCQKRQRAKDNAQMADRSKVIACFVSGG
jgi:hypothetical protein